MKNIYSVCLVSFLLITMAVSPVFSTNPPNFLSVDLINQGNGVFSFLLQWRQGGDNPNSFNIYQANIWSETVTDFTVVETQTAYPGDTASMIYSKNLPVSVSGDYSFYVTAVKSGVESSPSAFLHKTFTQPPVITFTSTPSTGPIAVGDNYTYNATATVTPSGTINFALVNGPPTLTITTTGGLTWTPSAKGTFTVTIKAFLVADPTVFNIQSWNIQVKQCATDGTISGTVLDEDGNPINSGTVNVYGFVADTAGGHMQQITGVNIATGGTYSINLDGGTYYLFVSGSGFDSEWWENQTTQQTANPVVVNCGSTTTANFVVHTTPPEYVVTGNVSKTDGTPLDRAIVHFYGLPANETNQAIHRTTRTNSSGDYSISLPNNYNYKAMAEGPPKDSLSPAATYYQNQFWDHVANPNDASFVASIGNTLNISNINFGLDDANSANNKIYGKAVSQSTSNNIPSWIIVFNMSDPAYGFRTYDATSNGNFEIHGLADGNYIIQSIPVDYTQIPGYYNDAGVVFSYWGDASLIPIISTSQSGLHTVIHATGTGDVGEGVFNGIIVGDGFGKVVRKGDGSDKTLKSVQQSAALIYLISKNKQQIVKCGASNHTGNYNISKLPLEDFDVIIDKVGYHKAITSITLDKNNKTVTKQIEIIPMTVGVDDDINVPYVAVYPNPVTDFVNLDFISNDSKIDVSIINTVGNPVYSTQFDAQSGKNKLSINTKSVPSGLYMLKISDKNHRQSIPLIVTR